MARRLLPQNIEAEEAVVASILTKGKIFAEIDSILTVEDFYRQDNRIIYTVMQELFTNDQPIDVITVVELLNKKKLLDKVGGMAFINKLCEIISSPANAKHYANIVREKSDLRRLIDASETITDKAYEQTEDTEDIIDGAEREILAVASRRNLSEFTHIKPITDEAIELIDKLTEQKGQITGVRTNFIALDTITSGLQPSDLILIAARPSMGKTAFVLNIAANVAKNGASVAFFSLEMSKTQLVMRLLASESQVNAQSIRTGDIDRDEFKRITDAADDLSKTNFFIDDTFSISAMEIRSKARRIKAEYGLDLIIIDYLQLMRGRGRSSGDNRQQEISEISRSLKSLAKELDVPLIALSQLSRSVESRQVKRPMLSDLRESGSLEQDADIVMFLYREDYYDESLENSPVDLIIAKHRNGAIGTVQLGFQKEYTKFTSLSYKEG